MVQKWCTMYCMSIYFILNIIAPIDTRWEIGTTDRKDRSFYKPFQSYSGIWGRVHWGQVWQKQLIVQIQGRGLKGHRPPELSVIVCPRYFCIRTIYKGAGLQNFSIAWGHWWRAAVAACWCNWSVGPYTGMVVGGLQASLELVGSLSPFFAREGKLNQQKYDERPRWHTFSLTYFTEIKHKWRNGEWYRLLWFLIVDKGRIEMM